MSEDTNDANPPTLFYFADPMCSWCWGFSPVIESIATQYRDRMAVSLVMGGLRPGTREPLSREAREEILHHWHEVQRMTGQPFTFEDALPDGFVYDTEPPSRAALTVGELRPDVLMRYFRNLHEAFYVRRCDITRLSVVRELAREFDIEPALFEQVFASTRLYDKALKHFAFARRLGITGFPTTVLVRGSGSNLLASGFRPLEQLTPLIDRWLDAPSGAMPSAGPAD